MADPFWSIGAEAALSRLGASPQGLSLGEAAARLSRNGPNSLQDAERADALRLFLRQFESPLVLILAAGSVVALALREWTEGTIILLIIFGSTALGFAQEYHASRAVAALRNRLALRSRVLRDGAIAEIPAADIVAGDVVVLAAGNVVPADGLILEARDFLVMEASFTGEPFPVEKRPGVAPADAALPARVNCVFAGSSVRSGEARVLVARTGKDTEFGAVAARLKARAPETQFSHGLKRFGYLLLRVAIVLVVFVLTINQILGRPFFESLLFSVALAVGLSPELLPAIVSVTLASGARKMARRGVLVRRLEAIENLGGIDVFCTDKTGTLTEGAVALEAALDPLGAPSERAFALVFANAALETGIENALDQAICAAGRAKGLDAGAWRKLDEIPYDFQRKRLAIAVAADDGARLIVKGAVDSVLGVCTAIAGEGGQTIALDPARRAELEAQCAAFGAKGLRTLALATRAMPLKADYTRDDEAEMVLEGFLTFLDPLKPDAKKAIEDLQAAGVAVKILSGDNRYVGAHIAEALGLETSAMLRGEDIDRAKGAALMPLAERASLFVEVDPQQKERIVRALKQNGRVVGFLGDGVNDAPALHAADVGVSVDGAVDVAREAADVILLDRDLGVLKQGVEDGRRAFANTIKYVSITTGSSFGNMISMALATPILPFLPLTATQVLLTNFLTDLPLMAVSTDNVDPAHLRRPQRWGVKDIQRFMLVFGLISSLFDIAAFAMLRFVFHADAAGFQTAWFTISVLTELAALIVLRTRGPAWKSRPSAWILWFSGFVAAAALAAPWIAPVADALGLERPSWALIFASLAIVVCYALATEAAKAAYYRRLGRAPRGLPIPEEHLIGVRPD